MNHQRDWRLLLVVFVPLYLVLSWPIYASKGARNLWELDSSYDIEEDPSHLLNFVEDLEGDCLTNGDVSEHSEFDPCCVDSPVPWIVAHKEKEQANSEDGRSPPSLSGKYCRKMSFLTEPTFDIEEMEVSLELLEQYCSQLSGLMRGRESEIMFMIQDLCELVQGANSDESNWHGRFRSSCKNKALTHLRELLEGWKVRMTLRHCETSKASEEKVHREKEELGIGSDHVMDSVPWSYLRAFLQSASVNVSGAIEVLRSLCEDANERPFSHSSLPATVMEALKVWSLYVRAVELVCCGNRNSQSCENAFLETIVGKLNTTREQMMTYQRSGPKAPELFALLRRIFLESNSFLKDEAHRTSLARIGKSIVKMLKNDMESLFDTVEAHLNWKREKIAALAPAPQPLRLSRRCLYKVAGISSCLVFIGLFSWLFMRDGAV